MPKLKAKCQIRRRRLIFDPNLTIEGLCKLLEKFSGRRVPRASMGDYETGPTEPKPSLLCELADLFGCEMNDMWAPDPSRPRRSK